VSIGDSLCDSCGRKQPTGFAGVLGNVPHFACRDCAGKWCQMLLRYIRGFDRDRPPVKRPRNKTKPITDSNGTVRCRQCEMQMHDRKPGDSPYCATCQERPVL
jgi:hypothetical protein